MGGLRRIEQEFHEGISEVGSNLMLVAGMGLVVPAVFFTSLQNSQLNVDEQVLQISRATAVILLIAYVVYILFQTRSHAGMYDELLAGEESKHHLAPGQFGTKLTMTESVIAIVVSLTIVCFMAVFLVEKIDFLVHQKGVKDA
jgi:Ca2+:H+ antiporter